MPRSTTWSAVLHARLPALPAARAQAIGGFTSRITATDDLLIPGATVLDMSRVVTVERGERRLANAPAPTADLEPKHAGRRRAAPTPPVP